MCTGKLHHKCDIFDDSDYGFFMVKTTYQRSSAVSLAFAVRKLLIICWRIEQHQRIWLVT